jgi:hypothetical protein
VYRNATDYNNRANGQAAPLAEDAKLSGGKSLEDAYIVVVPEGKRRGDEGVQQPSKVGVLWMCLFLSSL